MKKNKYFIITIDTEGDNQWDNNKKITTVNSKYLPRFQELAEKYEFKPVWLTNYEMANDAFFVNYMKEKQDKGLCEIGMHLHAWNNPPEYKLEKKTNERSYLIEYPTNIMEEKIKYLDRLLTKKFNKKPISHRSGRWALDDRYKKILKQNGYKIDCSVTPGIDWTNKVGITGKGGSNYKKNINGKFVYDNGLIELPVTIKKIHNYEKNSNTFRGFLGGIKRKIFGKQQWLRPDKYFRINDFKSVIDKCENDDYLMFMIHSSELMPGGSPSFKTQEDINKLYNILDLIFEYIKNKGYVGITIREYYGKEDVEKNEVD